MAGHPQRFRPGNREPRLLPGPNPLRRLVTRMSLPPVFSSPTATAHTFTSSTQPEILKESSSLGTWRNKPSTNRTLFAGSRKESTEKLKPAKQGSLSRLRLTLSNVIREERTRRLQEAQSRLFSILQQGPIRYEHLQPRILEIPLVWNTDLSKLLIAEHKAGRLIIVGLSTRQRVPQAGNRIWLPKRVGSDLKN